MIRRGTLLSVSIFVLAAACGGGDQSLLPGVGGGAASGQGGAASGSGANSSGSGGFDGNAVGSGGGTSGEVCDGVDNDGNGVIDDVDLGGDGICDCLRIATLGAPGMWGDGDVFSTWLDDRSDDGAIPLDDAVLTPALLAGYQVIVAQDLSKMGRSYESEEIEALEGWVEAGGGFMTLIGYADATELANANALLGAFGMSYEPTAILPKSGGSTVPVASWVPHPVTQGVSLVGVDNGYPVAGAGIALASEQGHDVLLGQEVSQGHVLMWGDEWITYDSEWTDHPEYQVELFWLNAIKWLTPTADCQVPIPE